MQLTIVLIIVACAFAFAAYRFYKMLTDKSGKCAGCPLKDACNKKNKKDI